MCARFQLANIAFFFEIPRIRFTICQITSRPVESQPRGASISLSTQKAHGIVGLRPSECKENGFPGGPWGPGPPGSTSHVYIPYRREVIQGVKRRMRDFCTTGVRQRPEKMAYALVSSWGSWGCRGGWWSGSGVCRRAPIHRRARSGGRQARGASRKLLRRIFCCRSDWWFPLDRQ